MPYRAIRLKASIAVAALLSSVALLAVLASGSTAKVQPQSTPAETYSMSFSPNQPKSSTSLTVNLSSTHQPASVTLSLPAGATLNSSVVPTCSTPPACEPATQVGSGSVTVLYNSYVIPLVFGIFNRPGGIAMVINNPNGSPITELPTWSGTQLVIPYPNGFYKGLPIVVNKLSLTFNKIGSGSRSYIRTPSTCPKSGWKSPSTFSFSSLTGTNTTGTTTTPAPTTGGTTSTVAVNATAKCSLTKPKKKSTKKKS